LKVLFSSLSPVRSEKAGTNVSPSYSGKRVSFIPFPEVSLRRQFSTATVDQYIEIMNNSIVKAFLTLLEERESVLQEEKALLERELSQLQEVLIDDFTEEAADWLERKERQIQRNIYLLVKIHYIREQLLEE
jgi:16S rRNA C1402 (ribose-2'-O) methylase RsmI